MKVLLVFLVFFFLSYSSNAQMQEEGTTVTTETTSEIQGDLEKVTTTTTTTVIENKNSGAILSSESTGIVATRYEGDMDQDWGGQGSINSHTSCNGKLGEYAGSNTCASARLDSLTTWDQTVNLNQFSIDDGGQVRWEMRFGMEPSMYNDANKNAFVELKGYDGGALQWTDVYNVDKTTFALSNSGTSSGNYLGPNGYIYDNLDYANGLDSLYINVGGYGEYMFDSVWFDIYYNQIETTVAETIVYNLIEQEIQNNTSIAIPDYTYNGGGDNSNNSLPPQDVVVIDLGIDDTPPPIEDTGGDTGIDDNFGAGGNSPSTTITVFTDTTTSTPSVTQTTDNSAGASVDTMFNNITMDIDTEEISNIQVMVDDIANTDITTPSPSDTNTSPGEPTETTISNVDTNNDIEPPPVINAPSESEGSNENTTTENIQEVETETTQVESESTNEVNTDTASNENETETTETASNEENSEPETTNQVSENTETEEVKEEAQEESQPEETETASEEQKEPVQEAKEEVKEETKEEEPKKEVAEKETKEEPKKETKEEPKKETEEKQVAEKEPEEKAKPEEKQTKEEKKQEQKQDKAKKIMANFDNQYDAIAQITTLALVNALGPNMSSYAQQPIVQAPTWYEPKDIYSDVLIPDPLGNYFGVRDSLTFNKMIDMQYE